MGGGAGSRYSNGLNHRTWVCSLLASLVHLETPFPPSPSSALPCALTIPPLTSYRLFLLGSHGGGGSDGMRM